MLYVRMPLSAPDTQLAPRPRVLLVEDDEATRTALARWLAYEYEVTTAPDGVTALEALSRPPLPDVIIADVSMPGLDGVAMVRRIKGSDPLRRLPVIFLTGQASPQSVIAGIAAGARAYLIKPVDLDVLDRKLRSALRARASRS